MVRAAGRVFCAERLRYARHTMSTEKRNAPQPAPEPAFFDNPAIDNLIAVTLELGAELWVQRERMRGAPQPDQLSIRRSAGRNRAAGGEDVDAAGAPSRQYAGEHGEFRWRVLRRPAGRQITATGPGAVGIREGCRQATFRHRETVIRRQDTGATQARGKQVHRECKNEDRPDRWSYGRLDPYARRIRRLPLRDRKSTRLNSSHRT